MSGASNDRDMMSSSMKKTVESPAVDVKKALRRVRPVPQHALHARVALCVCRILLARTGVPRTRWLHSNPLAEHRAASGSSRFDVFLSLRTA
jgi:hypothetical protein